jgi:hypothetical protein
MPNKALRTGVLAVMMLACAGTLAAAEETDGNAPEKSSNRPEHQARPLPTDTFNPSEEISEDFPVPFPVDI